MWREDGPNEAVISTPWYSRAYALALVQFIVSAKNFFQRIRDVGWCETHSGHTFPAQQATLKNLSIENGENVFKGIPSGSVRAVFSSAVSMAGQPLIWVENPRIMLRGSDAWAVGMRSSLAGASGW